MEAEFLDFAKPLCRVAALEGCPHIFTRPPLRIGGVGDQRFDAVGVELSRKQTVDGDVVLRHLA